MIFNSAVKIFATACVCLCAQFPTSASSSSSSSSSSSPSLDSGVEENFILRDNLRYKRSVNWVERCKRNVLSDVEYATIIDAGSSGSRIRVYRWERLPDDDNRMSLLPDFKEILNYKKHPGVSDLSDNWPKLTNYLKELIGKALEQIPHEFHDTTDLYFMSTAGMRLLLEDKANEMISSINRLLMDKTVCPFRYLSPDNSRILSGEEEGVFAWIAVNYLKGVFNKKNTKNNRAVVTYGVLELGGASTQIAFAPGGNILADKFPVLISGVTYSLYVHSFLHYGQNYVDLWVKEQLYDNQTGGEPLPSPFVVNSPCMVKGDEQHAVVKDNNVTFSGTGSYEECRALLEGLVYKVQNDWKCHPKPCSIGPVYQPTINPSMEFIAVGAFVHAFRILKILQKDGQFSYSNVTERTKTFCSLDKSEVLRHYKPYKEEYTSVPCLMGTYSPMLWTRGYNFQEDTNKIFVKEKIENRTADWTLGAIIYEHERKRKGCSILCPIANKEPPPQSTSALITQPNFVLFIALIFIACVL